MQRVDPITKECPPGSEPCSLKTSVENTICYPKSDHKEKCPIIDIKILPSAEANLKYKSYDKIPYFEDQVLLYTTTEMDSAPVTATQVEYKPCASPFEISKSPEKFYFELEVEKESTCKPLTGTQTVYDERYRDVGFSVTEWEVQNLSGVWQTLM